MGPPSWATFFFFMFSRLQNKSFPVEGWGAVFLWGGGSRWLVKGNPVIFEVVLEVGVVVVAVVVVGVVVVVVSSSR